MRVKVRNEGAVCRCGTGNYCARHGRYAKPSGSAYQDDQRRSNDESIVESERCGGGRRIVRKSISQYD